MPTKRNKEQKHRILVGTFPDLEILRGPCLYTNCVTREGPTFNGTCVGELHGTAVTKWFTRYDLATNWSLANITRYYIPSFYYVRY